MSYKQLIESIDSGVLDAGASVLVLLTHCDVVGNCRANLDSKVLVHLLLLAATVGTDEEYVDGHE